jgi:hypothetical protein
MKFIGLLGSLLFSICLVLLFAFFAFNFDKGAEKYMKARFPSTYGLNDTSLRLRATWIDPFATDMDPRNLLLSAADEIDRFGTGNKVSVSIRDFWSDPFSPNQNLRDLIRSAADEIDRLESEFRRR